jgi:enoyl-[acyl-carrier protein] reductase/trans-2-enoyl-CoA reductase (NAD+)
MPTSRRLKLLNAEEDADYNANQQQSSLRRILMLIKPMVRSSICLNAHPEGCTRETERQIEYIIEKKSEYVGLRGPKAVLVVGCSTGYGLASRIGAAFGFRAATVGVSYEKEPSETSTGTPGWYNNQAFDAAATAEGLPAITLNGDAFSNDMKTRVIAAAKELNIKFDLVVYSLASPVRTDLSAASCTARSSNP